MAGLGVARYGTQRGKVVKSTRMGLIREKLYYTIISQVFPAQKQLQYIQ